METLEFTVKRYWCCPHGSPHVEHTTFLHAPGDPRAVALGDRTLRVAKADGVRPNRWLQFAQLDPMPPEGSIITFEQFVYLGGVESPFAATTTRGA